MKLQQIVVLAVASAGLLATTYLFFKPERRIIYVPQTTDSCAAHHDGCLAVWIIPAHTKTVIARNTFWWAPGAAAIGLLCAAHLKPKKA